MAVAIDSVHFPVSVAGIDDVADDERVGVKAGAPFKRPKRLVVGTRAIDCVNRVNLVIKAPHIGDAIIDRG
jgi:hypothetical protein